MNYTHLIFWFKRKKKTFIERLNYRLTLDKYSYHFAPILDVLFLAKCTITVNLSFILNSFYQLIRDLEGIKDN